MLWEGVARRPQPPRSALPSSVVGLNRLPLDEQRRIYGQLIPRELYARFDIDPQTFRDASGQDVLHITPFDGGNTVQLSLFARAGDRDPLVFFHLGDTPNWKIIILLAVVNDPGSDRFDVDVMPDGTRTNFGTFTRNIAAEEAALKAGLAPGQTHRGLHLMRRTANTFEDFIASLGHDMYYAEPLHYHNAINLERMGFAYQQGRRWMESINTRFSDPQSAICVQLNGSTPFRQPEFAHSIRGRSWAIHDGILGEPFTGVRMYKRVGHHAGVNSFPDARW